jgi:hypothetical protein
VAFGPQPNSLIVVSASGSFYKVALDPTRGGSCSQESSCKFIELGAEGDKH